MSIFPCISIKVTFLGCMSTSRYRVAVKFEVHIDMDTVVLWTDHQTQNQNHFKGPKNFRSGGILGDFLL